MAQAIETFSDGLAALLHHIVDLNLASDLTQDDIQFIQALEFAVTGRLRKPAVESLAQAGINPAAIQQGAQPQAGLPPMPGGQMGPPLSPSMNGVMPSPVIPANIPPQMRDNARAITNFDELRRQLS